MTEFTTKTAKNSKTPSKADISGIKSLKLRKFNDLNQGKGASIGQAPRREVDGGVGGDFIDNSGTPDLIGMGGSSPMGGAGGGYGTGGSTGKAGTVPGGGGAYASNGAAGMVIVYY